MKKIRNDQRGSTQQLTLLRETLRRLDTLDLRNLRAVGGAMSIIRPTTDP